VGISGANLGLENCYFETFAKTCNDVDGYYPGSPPNGNGLSKYMVDLNTDGIKEGKYVFSMLSTFDDLIMY
jgi:hypothetical protein